jgi:hypothetical protein
MKHETPEPPVANWLLIIMGTCGISAIIMAIALCIAWAL